jgi:NAD(P)H-quinone oxidoreductase subunit J
VVDETEAKASEQAAPEATSMVEAGPVTKELLAKNYAVEFEATDHLGVEIVKVKAADLLPVANTLYNQGYVYLRCQCAYDVGPGDDLVSVYHIMNLNPKDLRQVRLKVYLPRDNPRVPSVYWIWRTADWQERESFDMYGVIYEGHPNLIRILMPEDWVGYPMRKDYITPDFYELQDAY